VASFVFTLFPIQKNDDLMVIQITTKSPQNYFSLI